MLKLSTIFITMTLCLFSCSNEALAPLLTESDSFAGPVTIQSKGSTSIDGDLAFDRKSGNLQWTRRDVHDDAPRASTVRRAADGKLQCFINAELGALDGDLRAQFLLLEALLKDSEGAVKVVARDRESFTIDYMKTRYRISASERSVLRGH